MKRVFKYFRMMFTSILIRVALAMHNVETEFKAKVSDLFGKKEFKKRNNNPVLNKMEQGQTDERYVQQYYEILKKADEVVRSTNPDKAAKMADKYGVNIGAKDRWGVRWDHHGFLDPKHKHYGKTLKEIRDLEIVERQHDEDNYPVIAMFTNKSELSFVQATKVLKDENEQFAIPELHEMAKLQKFPLMVVRTDEVLNKIEQLVEFVHIKSITSKHYLVEMFIPTKYGIDKYDEDTKIFKELIDIDQVWFADDYGDKHAYRVTSFHRRSKHNEYVDDKGQKKYRYDVIKFSGEIIENLKVG